MKSESTLMAILTFMTLKINVKIGIFLIAYNQSSYKVYGRGAWWLIGRVDTCAAVFLC